MSYKIKKTVMITWLDPARKIDEASSILLDPGKGHILELEKGIVYFTYDDKRYETINTSGAFQEWVEDGSIEPL
jgi:hypothetical protein